MKVRQAKKDANMFAATIEMMKNESYNIKLVMRVHSIYAIIMGALTIVMPHGLYTYTAGNYNHMAHEFIRLYGCLTLAIGWLVWSTQDIKDGRLMRATSETFAICYTLQAAAMLRAQFTSPQGHTIIHWFLALVFLFIGVSYGYVRLFKKMKAFELPYENNE